MFGAIYMAGRQIDLLKLSINKIETSKLKKCYFNFMVKSIYNNIDSGKFVRTNRFFHSYHRKYTVR